jgi:hypothetical protein
LTPGECQVCGCTDEHACPGGCVWANASATLCSRCAQQAPELAGVELLEPELVEYDDDVAFDELAGDEIPW